MCSGRGPSSTPERSADNGGVQLGGSGTNLYSQLMFVTFF